VTQPLLEPPLHAWPQLRGQPAVPFGGGLINHTFRVGDPPIAAVQRLHPIFRPQVNEDIDSVTRHVAARGMETPLLLRTEHEAASYLDDEGRCWRALTWMRGDTVDRLREPGRAHEAGRLVGRWHRATADLRHEFRFTRAGAHDTAAHMEKLRAAVTAHPEHRLAAGVARLAESILQAWSTWDGSLDGPARVGHGDLKINNLLFNGDGHGVCLVDLDTMAMLPLDIEMGDAWRSWCNPRGEDHEDAQFDLALFEASARGWLAENPIPSDDLPALIAGVERVALELSARFAADALNESYFGWNPAVAAGRGEHNLLRARGQASLAGAVRAARPAMERILRG
jgi:Ser/Thr protein kinase RdoA (MazF antagonist)